MEKTSSSDDLWRHLNIQPQCGACLEPFQHQDDLICLFRTGDVIEVHDACKYTWMGCCEQTNARHATFCKTPFCPRCRKEDESATVHTDCLQLFVRECSAPDKYFRLWRASVAMNPWRACSLNLPRKKTLDDLDVAAERRGLAMVKTLIPELRHMVMEAVGDQSCIWRYTTVVERARSLSGLETAKVVSKTTEAILQDEQCLAQGERRVVALDSVAAWSRNGELRISDSDASLIRITMDAFGIERIERLDAAETSTNPATTPYRMYIVEHPSNLSLIEAVFEDNFCRFVFPEQRHLTLLNASVTPDATWPIQSIPQPPPHLGRQDNDMAPIQQFGHLSLASTNHAWGITVFFHSGCPIALHSHTSSAPTAIETFRRISPSVQYSCVWLYFSLSELDEVLSISTQFIDSGDFKVRQRPCRLLITTKMQGEIKLGQHLASPFSMVTTETCRRPLLVNNHHPFALSVYKAHQTRSYQTDDIVPADTASPLISDGYLTEASLENVAAAHVFTLSDSQLCTGILLQYKDGTSRCLGQFRLGLDQMVSVSHPTQMYYTTATHTYPLPIGKHKGILVEFATGSPSQGGGDGGKADWMCQAMTGVAEFWVTHRNLAVRFRQA